MGIEPVAGANRKVRDQVRAQLDELRAATFGEPDSSDRDGGGVEPR
ncbi:MAG TPA: hypothetical protein VFI65_18505 [Streptosporangiaceae bacterium]|nr:hypothetical protein [Streptosporangiaceae bacterium]